MLWHSIMHIFIALGEVFGSNKILYEIDCRWRKIFLTGTPSIKDTTKQGQPLAVTGKSNILKIRKTIKSDGRYRIREIAISFWSTNDFCQIAAAQFDMDTSIQTAKLLLKCFNQSNFAIILPMTKSYVCISNQSEKLKTENTTHKEGSPLRIIIIWWYSCSN